MDSKHTTYDEYQFLRRLGSYSKATPGLDRADLLRNYLDAMAFRSVWGDIDQYKVLRYAQRLLALEENVRQET